MSAFVVSREHIDYMVRAARELPGQHSHLRWTWDINRRAGTYQHGELRPGDHEAEKRLGQMLWDENVRSVCYRYPDCDPLELPGPVGACYVYDAAPSYQGRRIEPMQTFAAIDCYEYQSCEHDEWYESEAFAFCDALRRAAIMALPGRDDCAWEIAS